MIGDIISHYKIVSKLGSGGMGEVYLAEDTSLRRKVAMKFLSPEKQQDQSAHFRILREARSAACLEHANICTIHEIGSIEGKDFIVMEYVEGQTLKDLLAAGPLPLEETLRIVADIAEALEEAHEKGVIHKDLKPANIMITRKGQAKVMDFGLAMKSVSTDGLESSADTVTQTVWGTQTGGTPAYMSPEQLLGESIDARTDIFSLGIVFYEMLGGTHPFLAATSAATSDKILHEAPRPVNKTSPAIPEQVGKLIGRMMAKDPKDRPGSARELLVELRAATHMGGSAHSIPAWIRDFGGHKRGVTAALSIALLLLLAGVLFKMRPATQSEEHTAEWPSKIYMAVLPFEVISGTDEDAHFGRGLIETINARLTKITVHHTLQVVPASEVRDKDVRTIEEAYRQFGVNLILEGTINWVGEKLRINFVFIDPETREGLGGDSITAAASDPLDLEDKVTDSILGILRIQLLPEEEQDLFASQPTLKPGAYNNYIKALGYLQEYQIPENVQSAIDELENALKQDSKFALAYAALGRAYWYQYRPTKDAKFVEKALDACSRAVELNRDLADGHACLGIVFDGTGKYEQAVKEYERAVDLDPSSDDACLGLGEAYQNLGEFSEAEATYLHAIELRPEYWAGYNLLGAFYTRQGRYADAAKQFGKVTDLTPRNFLGYSNLGGVYLYEGRYEEAIRKLKDSVALRPTESAYSNLGSAYFYQRRFSEAADAYLEATRLNERNYIIWGNLGDAYYWDPENRARADAAYRQALLLGRRELQVNPRDAVLISYMAYYHAMLNEKEEARSSANTALAIDQQSFEVLFNLAQTACRLGDTDQTLDWLKRAMAAGLSEMRIRNTPLFDPLQSNPEFQRLLKAN